MSFENAIREDARLIILKALAEQTDHRLNSSLLAEQLDLFGIRRPREWVHEELRYLHGLGAVAVTEIGSVRIAEITLKGLDHIERRTAIEGVKRPSPKA